ncbi:MAG: Ig-like domain-containing protein, partial [Methanomicrobiales archaeon]
ATFTIPATTADPTITLNKTSANVGDGVSITLANFGDAARAAVTMDGTTLNSSMQTTGAQQFTVPTKSGGTYTITATNTTEDKTATATFTIVPEVTDYIPGDTAVYAGDSYELRGDGFVSGTRYAILWNPAEYGGELIGDFYAASNGEIPDDGTATFTIPTSSNGKHLIDIATYADQTSSVLYGNMLWGEEPEGSAYPNQNFTGATYFQAAPLNPQIGDSITITGSNLVANDVVTMTDWNGVTYNLTADASGSVTRSWSVPYLNNSDLTPGMNGPLTFVGSKDYGAVNLLVYDNVDLSKTSGAPGEQVTVTGNGFKKNTQYYIFLNQSSTGTDSYVGQFTATGTRGAIPTGTVFTVPTTLDTGSYNVLIVDRNTWPAAGGTITNHDIPTFTVSGALDHIAVTPETASLEIGGTQSFTCTGYDTEGNVVTVTPSWSVDPAAVGTINSEGLFVANENGTATVTATVTQGGSTFTDTATVTVGGAGPTPTIDSITVTPSTWNMQVGEEKAMTAMGYSGSEPVELTTATWSSDDASIATVTGSAGSGTATGAGAGTATISVTQEGVTGTATLNVYTDITDAYKDPSTGTVTKAKAVDAVNDYLFNDKLSKTDAVTVVNAYLFG